MSSTATISVATFEEAALLRCLGFEFQKADAGERRVSLTFADPQGKGAQALRDHNARGVEVNSRNYADALGWAKGRVFAAKDGRR